MSANGVVGNAHRNPHCTFTSCALSHHLHNPSLVGIADGESFATRVIAIGVYQSGHHVDSLACRFATLQGDVYKRAIVYQTRRVGHFFTSSVCGFTDADLMFVDVSDNVIGDRSLWNFAQILMAVPIEHLTHFSFGVLSCGEMTQSDEHTVVVGIICAEDRPVFACLFTHNEVGASIAAQPN